MKLQDLVNAITDLVQARPETRGWDVVSVDCIFSEMFIALGSAGEYVGLGQQRGPESLSADSTL